MQTSSIEYLKKYQIITPRRWEEQLANKISDFLCPPIMGSIILLVSALTIQASLAWLWALFIIFTTIGLPVIYVLWKVQAGEISDFHIPIRSQRFRPIILTLGCALVCVVTLWLGRGPELFLTILLFGLSQTTMILLITFWWKISGHTMSIASLAIISIYLFGPACLPTLLLIPVVAWARIRIRRHTLAQTVAGAILGLSINSLIFII